MLIIGKHAKISKKLGLMLSMKVTLSLFNLTRQSLANLVIFKTFISIIGEMKLHNNVVSLVCLFFRVNWFIPSYSVGKLTITMLHVHIVVHCQS